MSKVVITNETEREAAVERSNDLIGYPSGSHQERELKAIADAIEAYDVEHAVVSGMTEAPK